MNAGRGTPRKEGYCEEHSYARHVPTARILCAHTEGKTMGRHGCEHKCGTCGRCNVKTCPNRVKCKGHRGHHRRMRTWFPF